MASAVGMHLRSQMQPSCRIGAAPPTCAVRRSALRSRSESSRSSTALAFTSGRQLPWRSRRGQPCAAQAASGEPCGMILEADTVVVDLHDSGHRSAFNRAFKVMQVLSVALLHGLHVASPVRAASAPSSNVLTAPRYRISDWSAQTGTAASTVTSGSPLLHRRRRCCCNMHELRNA